jgi:hypothetical protein
MTMTVEEARSYETWFRKWARRLERIGADKVAKSFYFAACSCVDFEKRNEP